MKIYDSAKQVVEVSSKFEYNQSIHPGPVTCFPVPVL